VKADAYGLGAAVIASTLQAQGCTHFFVANAAEGQALRAALGNADSIRIYVFEGVLAATLPTLLAAQLTPVINSINQWQLWSQAYEQSAAGRKLELVVHIDTGMQRLGLAPVELADMVATGRQPDMLMTHLACADEPGHPSVAAQLQKIVALAAQYPGCNLSLANSAGTLGAHNLAGIALYGGAPFTEIAPPNPHNNQIWPVARLEGQVLQLRDVAAGTAVGYGASFVATEAMRVATVGLGYADGLPRLLSNVGAGFAAGHRLPIVGRVSMDLTCVDVSAATLAEGDWIEFFGQNLALAEVAGFAQTIDYEILCGIGGRVPRIYQAL
ncbi:UNVERIFIED_CONTAM: hypothetical protein GTU68_031919, partial [Idotea baltica]|nr:hypothetical protein [Idotea baltica]